jgi:hypothetical protein
LFASHPVGVSNGCGTWHIVTWKKDAEMWTEDLYVLEGFMLDRMLGGDREGLEAVKKMIHESVPGEWKGLRELE